MQHLAGKDVRPEAHCVTTGYSRRMLVWTTSDEIGLIQSDMTNVSLILGYFQHQSRSSCDKRMIIL